METSADTPPVASTSALPTARSSTTQAHEHVLFRLPGKVVRSYKLTPGGTLLLGKLGHVAVEKLIGLSYGTTYEVQGDGKGDLVPARLELAYEPNEDEAATNEHIASLGTQGLSAEDIEALRSEGAQGRDIVLKQTTANSSFDQKTSFAKQKYIARKEAKYLKLLTPLPPTLSTICDYALEKSPSSYPLVQALRSDTLAQLLSLANIRSGSRALIVDDTTSSLLTSAVLSRMNGEGRLFLIVDTDSDPPLVMLPLFNLTERERKPLRWLNWVNVDPEWQPADVETLAASNEMPDGTTNTASSKVRARLERRREKLAELEADRQDYAAGEFDALIIASTYDPTSIVEQLLPKLAGSAQLVVTSSVIQPLSSLTSYLKDSRDFIAPTLTEPTLRRYQVLLGRTHPDMNGMVHGGYLLSATRVFADPEGFTKAPKQPQVNGSKRKRREEGDTS